MQPSPDRESTRRKTFSFARYFDYLMVVVYLALGLTLLLSDVLASGFPETQRKLLGGLLLAYALYRAYAVTRQVKTRRNEDQDR